LNSLDAFCTWLAATPVSQAIQTAEWIVPAVQTVHILAVAAVITSVLMIDLRLLGIGAREGTIASTAKRFLPFIWFALPVLLATGVTLIIAEPSRALKNPVFLAKMTLLIAAVAITVACQIPLQRDAAYWDQSAGRRRAAQLIAFASLPLWIAIIFAGRWIAYVQGS
jgi:hypothetical protein